MHNHKVWTLILVVFFSFHYKGQAQFYIQGYDPSITQVELCKGQTFTLVQDHDLVADISFDFKAPDRVATVFKGSDLGTFDYTYDESGTFTISVLGNQTAGTIGKKYEKKDYIVVLPSSKPKFTIKRCQHKTVKLEISDDVYDLYEIDFGDGSPTTKVPKGTSIINHTYGTLGNFNIKVRGIHVLNDIAKTECGNVITEKSVNIVTQVDPNYSSTVTKPQSYCEGQVEVSFDTQEDYRYILEQTEGGNTKTVMTIPIENPAKRQSKVIDKINTAKNNIRFVLKVFDDCSNLLRSIPDQKIFVAPDIPIEIQGLNATHNEQGILISWEQPSIVGPDFNSFEVLRDGEKITSVQSPSYQDIFDDEVHCYDIQHTNSCGIKTLTSLKTCPMHLKLNDSRDQLNWTPYQNGTTDPIDYTVIVIADGQEIAQIPTPTTQLDIQKESYEQYQTVSFKIQAKTRDFISHSNEVKINFKAKVYFPTAFTPNADGLNDTFEPVGRFIQKMDLKIFDQNGKMIYASDKVWDGTVDGTPQPSNTYIYIAEVTDKIGNTETYKGSFVLIR